MTPGIKIMTWDWKEPGPDISTLGTHVTEVSGGTVHVYEVMTDGDDLGILISPTPLTPDQVQRDYWQWRGVLE